MAMSIEMGEELYQGLVDMLREEQPYMKMQRVEDCAVRCRKMVEDYIANSAEIEDTKSRVSFFSLSAELRNRIYEYALIPGEGEGGTDGHAAIYIGKGMNCRGDWEERKTFEGYMDSEHYEFGWLTTWVSQPALTRVSRQIREETLPIYYAANHFAAAVDGYSESEDSDGGLSTVGCLPVRGLLSWIVCIGQKNIDRLQHLRIFLDTYESGVRADGSRHETDPARKVMDARDRFFVPEYIEETADVRIRRWLERELSNKGLTMPQVSLTTHTWCFELNGGEWLQTT